MTYIDDDLGYQPEESSKANKVSLFKLIDWIRVIVWTLIFIWIIFFGGFFVISALVLGIGAFLVTNLWALILGGLVGLIIYKLFKGLKTINGRFRLLGIRVYNEIDRKSSKKKKRSKPTSTGFEPNILDHIMNFVGLAQFLAFWARVYIVVSAFFFAWLSIIIRWSKTDLPWRFGENDPPQIRPIVISILLYLVYPILYFGFAWPLVLAVHLFLILLHAIYGWYVYNFAQYGK